MPTARVYEAYRLWMNDRHHTRLLNKQAFMQTVAPYLSALPVEPKRVNGTLERCVYLRPLGDARNYFDAKLKTSGEWDDAPGASLTIPF